MLNVLRRNLNVIRQGRGGPSMDQTTRALKPMDVEEVLKWACGQELPRKGRPAAAPTLRRLDRGRDAELVGRWIWPAGFPAISPMFAHGFVTAGNPRGGPPDQDALLVETAIGAVGAAMAGRNAPDELALDIGLGVDIDGAFASALGNVGNLLLAHGRLGNRPSIGAWEPKCSPRLAMNGKPGVWRINRIVEPGFGGRSVERDVEEPAPALKGRTWPTGAYGALEWDPDPQLVVNDRAEYLVWRLGLDELSRMLSGRLARIAALPTRAAMAPWLGHVDGDGIVDLFQPGTHVYAARDAAAMRGRRERRVLSTRAPGARRPARPGRGQACG